MSKTQSRRRVRLSPNEEARVLKEERDKRRILRLIQVRQLSKVNAADTREAVRREEVKQIEQLGAQLQDDWEKEKEERMQRIQQNYELTLKHIGEGHVDAVNTNVEHLGVLREKQNVENFDRASIRHEVAVKKQRQQRRHTEKEANRHINARQAALDIEKLRAADIAALPPKPRDPINDIPDAIVNRPIKVTDSSAFSTTHYHIPDQCAVDRASAFEQGDAHEAAAEKQRVLNEQDNEQKRLYHEHREKARLRGKHAMEKEILKQDYDELLHDLSDLQRADMNKRRQVVAKIPKQIYQLPFQHLQEKQENQCSMEKAFEDIYLTATDNLGDLSLALDPHPVPDSPAHTESLDLSYLTPERLKASEYGDVRLDKPEAGDRLEEHSPKHDMPKPSILGDLTNLPKGGAKSFFSKRPDAGLSKLLSRIRSQQSEPLPRAAAPPASLDTSFSQHPLSSDDDNDNDSSIYNTTGSTVIQLSTSQHSEDSNDRTLIEQFSEERPRPRTPERTPIHIPSGDTAPSPRTLRHPMEQAESLRHTSMSRNDSLSRASHSELLKQQQQLEQQKQEYERSRDVLEQQTVKPVEDVTVRHDIYHQNGTSRVITSETHRGADVMSHLRSDVMSHQGPDMMSHQGPDMMSQHRQDMMSQYRPDMMSQHRPDMSHHTPAMLTHEGADMNTRHFDASPMAQFPEHNAQIQSGVSGSISSDSMVPLPADSSEDNASTILLQQQNLQARIHAIEKQRELLKYRMAAQSSVSRNNHAIVNMDMLAKEAEVVPSTRTVAPDNLPAADARTDTAVPDLDKVRRYQEQLLQRRQNHVGALDESKRNLERRRNEIMAQFAPQLIVRHPDDELVTAHIRPGDQRLSQSQSEQRNTNVPLVTDQSQTDLTDNSDQSQSRIQGNESQYTELPQEYHYPGSTPLALPHSGPGFDSEALLRLLQRDKIPSQMDLFHDVSSMLTDTTANDIRDRRIASGNLSADSITSSFRASRLSEESHHASLPVELMATDPTTPKPASILEQIINEPSPRITPERRGDAQMFDNPLIKEAVLPNVGHAGSMEPNGMGYIRRTVEPMGLIEPSVERRGPSGPTEPLTQSGTSSEISLHAERMKRYSSSDSSFYGSISDSDYDVRQKDLEMQLLEIRRQKSEILERQSKHKEELNELHENYQKQISELSADKDTVLSNLSTTSETNLAQDTPSTASQIPVPLPMESPPHSQAPPMNSASSVISPLTSPSSLVQNNDGEIYSLLHGDDDSTLSESETVGYNANTLSLLSRNNVGVSERREARNLLDTLKEEDEFSQSRLDSESYEPSVHGILISSSTPNDSLQSVHNEQIDSFQPLPHSVSCEQSDESIASTNSSTRRTWSNELEQYRKVSTPSTAGFPEHLLQPSPKSTLRNQTDDDKRGGHSFQVLQPSESPASIMESANTTTDDLAVKETSYGIESEHFQQMDSEISQHPIQDSLISFSVLDSTGAPHLELSADAIEDKSSETNQQAQHHDSPVDQESIQRHLDAFLGAKIAADLTTSQYSYQSDVPLLQDTSTPITEQNQDSTDSGAPYGESPILRYDTQMSSDIDDLMPSLDGLQTASTLTVPEGLQTMSTLTFPDEGLRSMSTQLLPEGLQTQESAGSTLRALSQHSLSSLAMTNTLKAPADETSAHLYDQTQKQMLQPTKTSLHEELMSSRKLVSIPTELAPPPTDMGPPPTEETTPTVIRTNSQFHSSPNDQQSPYGLSHSLGFSTIHEATQSDCGILDEPDLTLMSVDDSPFKVTSAPAQQESDSPDVPLPVPEAQPDPSEVQLDPPVVQLDPPMGQSSPYVTHPSSKDSTLEQSLLSFEQHELSSNASSNQELHQETSEQGAVMSLQDAFLQKRKNFVEKSEKRQQELKEKPAQPSALSATLVKWKKSRTKPKSASGSDTSASSASGASTVTMVTKQSDDRKKNETDMKMRTNRLYNQLEEVKRQKVLEDRKQQYAENRQKAKEYQKRLHERTKSKK